MTDVRLAVYDLTGREITNLFEGKKEAGSYELFLMHQTGKAQYTFVSSE